MDSPRQALALAMLALAGCASDPSAPSMVVVPFRSGGVPVALPATVPLAGSDRDLSAKQFNVPADKAALYIYRKEFKGSATAMRVLVNGNVVGDTAYKTYIYIEVPAGQHVVTSKAENETSITIDAVPGRAYFVWQEVKTGWTSPRSALHLVDEPTGRAGVLESKLVSF